LKTWLLIKSGVLLICRFIAWLWDAFVVFFVLLLEDVVVLDGVIVIVVVDAVYSVNIFRQFLTTCLDCDASSTEGDGVW